MASLGMAPRVATNELDRLTALRSYEILDTPRDPHFDHMTTLASRVCDAPISTIALIDRDRQWFKSATGVNLNETPRDFAFCATTILQKTPLVIEDVRKDHRFADHPWVVGDPSVVFYAGVPLIDDDGFALGALSVVDFRPRQLSPLQLEVLEILAQHTVTQLSLRRAIHQNQAVLDNFQKMANHVPGVIYQFRMLPDGRSYFPYATNALKEVYELTPEQVRLDASVTAERLHPQDQAHAFASMLQSRDALTDWRLDYRVVLPKKGERWLRARSRPEKLADGGVQWSGFIEDVTEEKRLEKMALNQSKLAALGEMAASIAHEINNPLAIIEGFSEVLLKSPEIPESLKRKAEGIVKGTKRIAKIVASLKKFSRQDEVSQPRLVALRGVIDEALSLTRARAEQKAVQVQVECLAEGQIYCDELELEQVLVNLINNGMDAAQSCAEKWVRVRLFERGEKVIVQVRDSGTGIPESLRDRIFEPFFTTKAPGEGTGLGLSVVKGIVESCGGTAELLVDDPHTCIELQFTKR